MNNETAAIRLHVVVLESGPLEVNTGRVLHAPASVGARHIEWCCIASKIKGFIPSKLPKLDLTTHARQYVANLVKARGRSMCGCKRATVRFITWLCYTCIMTFFLLVS